ncbi:MAG: hypothetical protein PHV06_03720 [bacterium]|mgnify:CR=1 FL=1|nr:hypothetical protein [bacterium]
MNIKLISGDKIYHTSAFHYPQNDKGDEYLPDNIEFFNSFFSGVEGTGIVIGISFWQFNFESEFINNNPLDLVKLILTNEEIERITDYKIFPGINEKIIEANFNQITDLKRELSNLLIRFQLRNKKTIETCSVITDKFIKNYLNKYDMIIKGNFAYSDWFANEGIDFFYLIINKNIVHLLSFYESD